MLRGEFARRPRSCGESMSLSQSGIDALLSSATATLPADDPPAEAEAPPPAAARSASADQAPAQHRDIERILGLPVPVTVILAERDMTVDMIVEIAVGTIIEFDVSFDSELTLQVANRTIGYGQGVKIGENFGMRVSRIGTVRDRIDALGGQ